MSSGKANSRSLLDDMAQRKKNVTRSGRRSTSTYARDGSDAGGSGGGLRRGRGGGGGGGVDFEPPPSASGDVAPELFLEGPSGSQAETETESRDESDSGHEEGEGEPQPKKLSTRGESKVPDATKEPKTEEAKPRIIPNGKE